MRLILTKPLEGLDLPERLELGPFDSIHYQDGEFSVDGELVAETFEETADDRLSHVLGHPAAGFLFVPRTFHESESDHPDYPGKPYECAEIVS